jgi:hypothetical protein
MLVNLLKSNIAYLRKQSVSQCGFIFNIGNVSLKYVKQYKYLGLVLTHHLDFAMTAKTVSKSAHSINFNDKSI